MGDWVQKIYFGCPGVGKSRKVREDHKIDEDDILKVECIFHPEYTHADFMGKLVPMTEGEKITYRYYPGHFLRALAMAYREIKNSPGDPKMVWLIIDEINRGNTAQIFGPVLQLLDRDEEGWSRYTIYLSDLERFALAQEVHGGELSDSKTETAWGKARNVLKEIEDHSGDKLKGIAERGCIRIPPNLSIVGTMNTSDESVYYMDSAFKRRWSWEYVPLKYQPPQGWKLRDGANEWEWVKFIDNLNEWIREHSDSIRKVEDKQIGYYFVQPTKQQNTQNAIIELDQVRDKIMFFLWDSVFQRDKSPLENILGCKLHTFGEFAERSDDFIKRIMETNSGGPGNGNADGTAAPWPSA